MTQQFFDKLTKAQLTVLKEISKLSQMLGIKFWLRGGWAIDFLLGKITRPHDDIDLVMWIQDRGRIEDQLVISGYENRPVNEEFCNRQSDFLKNNVEITINYIIYSDAGSLIMNGLPEWNWRVDSLCPQTFMLEGVAAHILNPKQLLEEKEVYAQIGRTPRQKDTESKEILHQIINEER